MQWIFLVVDPTRVYSIELTWHAPMTEAKSCLYFPWSAKKSNPFSKGKVTFSENQKVLFGCCWKKRLHKTAFLFLKMCVSGTAELLWEVNCNRNCSSGTSITAST